MNEVPKTQVENTSEETRRPRLAIRILGLVMIITAVLIVWYAAVVYIGYQQGQTLLKEKQINTLTNQINTQLELARQNINESQYNLARTRLDWVLAHAPNNREAANLLTEIEARQNASPTTEITATVPPTPIPLPTPTPGLIGDPDEELARIQRIVENKNWEEAIKGLLAFQFQYPSHERKTTDQLLYDAYLARGLEIVEGEQVELGLAYFAEAEKLGNLPQEALDYQLWAELYMAGIAYYGVNWDIAAFNFRELCLSAPFFHDSCNLLQQSLINLGDQFAFGLDWCPAESYYQEAASYGADNILNDKLGQARTNCAAATPTPAGPITDTVGITNTETLTNP
ncbi:MAG: hypothetical protein CSA11_06845 [Chloroflexi bacterium]|nr:MAG: hypothetical protein CSB13_00430 [Chloroflexota bacterium]PIE80763.1 MAG: hypothetical protein CSA11_06845 [Chloroflexota bacterium]